MVANPSTNVLQFPSREEGYQRLLLEILRRSAGGEWTGGQPELAESLKVSTKTVYRWSRQARADGFLSTRGRTEKLTYRVLAVPAARPEASMTTAGMSEASDITTAPMSEAHVRSFGHREPAQIQPSRAGAPLSSSSSGFGHTASDITDPAMSEEDREGHDGNGGNTTITMTPILELAALFHVQATEQTATDWAELDAEAQRLVARKVRLFPSQKDRDNPPPAFLEAIVHTALEDQQARRLIDRVDPKALVALLDRVGGDEPESAPAPLEKFTSAERDAMAERITDALLWPWRNR